MGKHGSARRSSRRLANHASSKSKASSRTKGRARTRASGVKIIDDPMQDEKRLKDQLTQMGFYAVNTLGDGNCLFRALSDQLYGTPNRHLEIRHQVCTYLAQNESRYKAFVDTDEDQSWESHLEQMSKPGTYGGHLELSAFANFHRRPIKIIQPGMVYVISYQDELPGSSNQNMKNKTKGKGKRSDTLTTSLLDTPLYLVYHQWEHYSSVRNLDGPHCGMPNIREPDLEISDYKNHQTDHSLQEEQEVKDLSSDSIRQGNRSKSLPKSMMTYREPTSSPDSAGSVTTTLSSVVRSISSPSSTALAENTNGASSDKIDPEPASKSSVNPPTDEDKDRLMKDESSNRYQIKTRSQSRNHLNSNSGNLRPITPSQKKHHNQNPSNISTSNKKPLSKKELRQIRRNKNSCHHLSLVVQPQHELKSDTSVLLKELKV